MRFLRAWRLGWTLQTVQGPTPPYKRVDSTTQKVQGPTTPSERVGWTFQPVQGPWGGGPYTRGGVLQSDVRIINYFRQNTLMSQNALSTLERLGVPDLCSTYLSRMPSRDTTHE